MFDKTKLRALRLARGWTLKTLAEKSGVSYVVVRRLESGGSKGNRQPRLDTLMKLAGALLVPVEALLSGPEGEPMLGGHVAWGTDQPGGQLASYNPLVFSASDNQGLAGFFHNLAESQIDPEQLLAEMK